MRSKIIFLTGFLCFSLNVSGADQSVKSWLSSGSFEVYKPAYIQGQNLKKEDFQNKFVLGNSYLNLLDLKPVEGRPILWKDRKSNKWKIRKTNNEGFLEIKPEKNDKFQISYNAFYIESDGLNSYKLEVESPQMFQVFLNGKEICSQTGSDTAKKPNISESTLDLDRGKFVVIVKSMYVSGDDDKWYLKAEISGNEDSQPLVSVSPAERMNIHHLLEGPKLQSVSISPDGELVALIYSNVDKGTGKVNSWTEIKELSSGRIIQSFRKAGTTGYSWMPLGKKIYYRIKGEKGFSVWVYDLDKGKEYPVLEDVEELSGFQWSDDESFMIYSISEEGKPKEKSSLLYMNELGNRTFSEKKESYLYKYDVPSGVSERLTFGETGTYLNDISHDGRYIIFSTEKLNPTQRPFSLQNMYLMDLDSREVCTLWEDFRWGGYAQFSPDGTKLLVSGGPDCFGDLGKNIGKNPIANNYDGQLYIYELSSGAVNSLTAEFNPSVGSASWNTTDGNIYIRATDEIYSRAFVWNESDSEFRQMKTVPEVIGSFDVAGNSLYAVYTGNQLASPQKAWVMDLKTMESVLIDETESKSYEYVTFGESEEWDFVMDDGREIKGYFLYPRNFDANKKYPLIVNYYGGTSPIEKSFGGRYPLDIWAGEDYVVYVPQPSGAIGFGQEFSARHQNNWGITVADEIIQGTEKFMDTHAFVDIDRVGCIGASYGGFMTMYLQTKTDIFSCAISHAGISSLSSYWGEGYWGYIYSSEATGDAYPWNRKDIYIDQSPLFSADKINTPLLLLHGSEDTNVPLGESLQLWVGLKILGKPVEMVQVEGENHHILTYSKRIEWHNTIMAWFDKWLNGKNMDWEKLFPESEL